MLRLEGYTEKEVIHSSARSVVFRVVRDSDQQPFIVKTPGSQFPSTRDLKRLRHQYSVAVDLNVPGAVRPIALDSTGSSLALIMADFGGVSLDREVPRGQLSLEGFLDLAVDITVALDQLHRAGVIHRDVKPHNILRSPSTGEIRFCDFGSAISLRAQTESVVEERVELTPEYVAPELTRRTSQAVDHRADLYSLGVTFFELLTGKTPFHGDDALKIIHGHLARPPPSPRGLRADIPEVLAAVVVRLLAKNPDDRYRSARGLHADLVQCRRSLRTTGQIPAFDLGTADASARLLVPGRLYGRDRELRQLGSAIESVKDGPARLLLVTGYAGVGKSSLVAEAQAPATSVGGHFCAGKYDQLQHGVPFSAVITALRSLVRGFLSETATELESRRARLIEALGANGKLIVAIIPELGLIVGPQPEPVPLPPAEAQNRLRNVFLSFLRALCGPGQPLLLFLDDLQWADSASLALIEGLVTNETLQHILVIGAYRSNEVDATHPVSLMRERIERVRPVQVIDLKPLGPDSVGALIADALSRHKDEVAPLAALVSEKTGGNPFFAGQFLHSLVQEEILRFDEEAGRWRWDLDRGATKGLTDNVVDLMAERIQRIGSGAREVLQLASCIGNQFTLETLSLVSSKRREDLEQALDEALGAGLLLPVDAPVYVGDNTGAGAAAPGLRFLHDRVQQAAARFIPPERLGHIHVAIGRELLRATSGTVDQPAEARGERLFEILQHLNVAHEQLTADEERLLVAELNLQGARKAKAAGAQTAAREYARAGLRLLGAHPWQSQYRLCLDFHQEIAEASFLLVDNATLNETAATVVANARTVLECVPVHELRIRALTGEYKTEKAIPIALDLLRQLGVRMSGRPTTLAVARAILRTKWILRGRSAEKLLAMAPDRDPRRLAAMRVLFSIGYASFFTSPNLYALVSMEMVALSARHGPSQYSVLAWASWSLLMAAGLNDVQGATPVAALSLALVDKQGYASTRASALAITSIFNTHLTRHIRTTLEPTRRSVELGIEYGDHESAALGAAGYCSHLLAAGDPLEEVAREHERYVAIVRRLGQERFVRDFQRNQQFLACLLGRAENPGELKGPLYDADAVMAEYVKQNDLTALAILSYMQAWLQFFLGDVNRAAELIAPAIRNLKNLSATVFPPQIDLLAALIAARQAGAQPARRSSALRSVRASLKRLRRHEKLSPDNNAHRVMIVQAELDRLSGRTLEAMEGYQRAAKTAARQKFIQEAALANELAGRFFMEREQRWLARGHLEEARQQYLTWGATAVVTHLERELDDGLLRRPELAAPIATGRSTTSSDTDPARLDFQSVMRGAQALSGEIVLERLLRRLMHISIENAGAERALLILDVNGALRIMAEGSVGADEVEVLQAKPIDAVDAGVAGSVVQYVARTKEPLVLYDASRQGDFTSDGYVARRQSRSILCVPIILQGALAGAVYLENNLAPGVFTADRIEILRVLASQAAISLQNARLYQDLEKSLNHQLELTRAQSRFVPNEFLRSLNRTDILGVRLGENVRKEMSVLFSDIRGFTALVEGMSPQEHIDFINTYLGAMEPPIMDAGGFVDSYIGDAIMALFDREPDAAVRAGVGMAAGLDRLNVQRQRAGLPPVRAGMGVNTGLLTLGTIGGAMRVKCGVIGDPVNLASRVEGLTKTYDATFLITHHTHERLKRPAAFHYRLVDRVTVKGMSAPVTLYEVIDAEPAALREVKLRTAPRFREAVDCYYQMNFAAAGRLFSECLAENAQDKIARDFLRRCDIYRESGVLPGWAGVEQIDHK